MYQEEELIETHGGSHLNPNKEEVERYWREACEEGERLLLSYVNEYNLSREEKAKLIAAFTRKDLALVEKELALAEEESVMAKQGSVMTEEELIEMYGGSHFNPNREEVERYWREACEEGERLLLSYANEYNLSREEKAKLIAAFTGKGSALAEKDTALAEKDAALAEKDAALAEKDAALAEKDAALAEKDAVLTMLRAKLEEMEK